MDNKDLERLSEYATFLDKKIVNCERSLEKESAKKYKDVESCIESERRIYLEVRRELYKFFPELKK